MRGVNYMWLPLPNVMLLMLFCICSCSSKNTYGYSYIIGMIIADGHDRKYNIMFNIYDSKGYYLFSPSEVGNYAIRNGPMFLMDIDQIRQFRGQQAFLEIVLIDKITNRRMTYSKIEVYPEEDGVGINQIVYVKHAGGPDVCLGMYDFLIPKRYVKYDQDKWSTPSYKYERYKMLHDIIMDNNIYGMHENELNIIFGKPDSDMFVAPDWQYVYCIAHGVLDNCYLLIHCENGKVTSLRLFAD